jgi:hypothetical protein
MTALLVVALATLHVGLLGTWLGSMLYSLLVAQPRAARFFGSDDDAYEEFLVTLGAGNRRPVLAIITAVAGSGMLIMLVADVSPVLMVVELVLLGVAAAVFASVSWRLWPRRVFAIPAERPRHREVLRRHALAMVGLVGAAFTLAVVAIATPAAPG